MKLLHLLPPEAAHKLGIWALKNGFGPRAAPDAPGLEIRLFGKILANPIGLSAGAEKKAEALVGWARMGFGFVEAGTVTPEPRKGNPQPRIWRLGDGHVINWLGLPGDGLEPFAANLAEFAQMPERARLGLGASLAVPNGKADGFRKLSATCAPLVDYLTLNASCPNVSHNVNGDDPAQTAREQVRAVVAEAGRTPVLLKLGPTRDGESLKLMVGAAMDAGAAGIVATNTMPFDKSHLLGRKLPFDWPRFEGHPVGGYSGPLLLDTTLWMVEQTRALIGPDAPLIGVGGIQSGGDALKVMRAGANAVQVYTGMIYSGHRVLEGIKKSLLNNIPSPPTWGRGSG